MQKIHCSGKAYSPSKIVCVGRNYAAHAQELGNPIADEMVLFFKPNSAIGEALQSVHGEGLHYELELCLVLENKRYHAVGLGLDLTKRALQSRLKEAALPWERAKAFDGAALFSDFVPLPPTLATLSFELHIDGELRQQGRVEHMLYSPEDILKEITTFTSLEDGDVVMTGTPQGVGEVKKGAQFEARLFDGDKCLLQHSWLAQ